VCRRLLTSHRQTRQTVFADRQVSCSLQTSAGVATAEDLVRQFNAGKLQADFQSVNRVEVNERLVVTRLRPELLISANFTEYQSAYRKGHSTETDLLEILDGLYTAAECRRLTSHHLDQYRLVCDV